MSSNDKHDSNSEPVVWVKDEGSLHVRINRPHSHNAFTPRTYELVKAAVLIGESDPDISEIVIRGNSGAFATGGDLGEVLTCIGPESDHTTTLANFERSFSSTTPFVAILRCRKPVISVVDGYCLAGGLLVASSSDAVIATRRSVFGVPEALVGIADPWMPQLLARHIGMMRAKYMMLSGSTIDANQAESWGLITKVADDASAAESELSSLIRGFRNTSPDAKAMYKRSTTSTIPLMDGADCIRELDIHNVVEGLTAFRDKRKPIWRPLQ